MTRETSIRKVVKPVVFLVCLAPLGWIIWRALAADLGANPVESVNRFLGDWAIRSLLAALAVSPLAGLTGKPAVMRFRRMLGLFAFFYATLHMANYIIADQAFNWADIRADLIKRKFITMGMATFLILTPLALTSNGAMIRRLGGKRWRKLHRAVYLVGIGAVIHYAMMVKADLMQPVIYGAILLVLLGYRATNRKVFGSASSG